MIKRSLIGVIIISAFIPGIISVAKEESIQSKGNIEAANGAVKFYSEDIEYLESEINKLLRECQEG